MAIKAMYHLSAVKVVCGIIEPRTYKVNPVNVGKHALIRSNNLFCINLNLVYKQGVYS